MGEGVADAPTLETRRPGHDQGRAHAALGRVPLVQVARCVGYLCPVQAIGGEAALLAQGFIIGRIIERVPVPEHLVEPVGIGAIVRQDDEDGVIELAGRLQVIAQAADVGVGRVEHAGVHGHALGIVTLAGCVKTIPGLGGRATARRGAAREQAHLDLARVTLGANRIPARVVAPHIAVDERLGRLVRVVIRLQGHDRQEGLGIALVGVQKTDHAVDVIAGRIKILGQGDFLATLEPAGSVMNRRVRFALVIVRSGLRQRHRLLETLARGRLVGRVAEVPFAGKIGAVAGPREQRADRQHPVVQVALVARLALLVIGDDVFQRAHAGHVVVDPGIEHGAGRRTGRRHMEIGKAHTLFGHAVHHGRGDFAAKGTEVAHADIVEHDQHDIRALLGGLERRRGQREGGGNSQAGTNCLHGEGS